MNDSLKSIGTELRSRETRLQQYSLAHSAASVLTKTVAMTGFVAAMMSAANPAHAVSLVNGNFVAKPAEIKLKDWPTSWCCNAQFTGSIFYYFSKKSML